MAENDDPLGLLYLEPGAIDPSVSALGTGAVPSCEIDRRIVLDYEAGAISKLREISVMCPEEQVELSSTCPVEHL